MSDFEVRHLPESQRFEIDVENELAGHADYTRNGSVVAITHTVVDPRFEGRGIGSRLVLGALAELRESGASVLPVCPFVPKVMRDNPEFIELVPADDRARFGL